MTINAHGRAALTVLLFSGLVACGAAGQEIVRVGNAEAPLNERISAAADTATRAGESPMVGYGIDVLAPANEIWGMYSLRESSRSSRPSLSELLDGRRIDTRATNGDPDRLVERRAAVLIRLDSEGRPVDVRMVTLNSIADVHVDTIYWLGDVQSEQSFDLLVAYTHPANELDVRRGAVYSIARHGFPDRAQSVLKALIRDTSEPDAVRKAAVYGLGMLGTDEARRLLLDLIYDESS